VSDDEKLRDYLKRVTVDLRKARGRLRAVEERQHEPIAIVGVGCRYPGGVRSARDLWELLDAGGDAISAFPEDRGWNLESLYDPEPGKVGTSYVREGGFLHDAGDFDAGLFRISPREALGMDPQQRLLLEVSWEALEDGGIDPLSLQGSQTGVFAGISSQDYGPYLGAAPRTRKWYPATGALGSVVSGRVAYTFGLEGPAVTVDTACSSSLTALHLACNALRAGECSLALAGGVTVLATPWVFIDFSLQRGLARDGRCKSFTDAADGTSFSEGVGVLLLERLSDASRNGHQVLAVVRGSAVNQDGASNGLTAPNGPSQRRVIAQALANARVSAAQVDAVEGHGTGTPLGDPIEVQALLATYGREHQQGRPLWLGSVKSNIGHTQAAAGMAGVIKMVMAMRHGVLPRTLHVDEPSRQVDWSQSGVSLLTEAVSWPQQTEPRRAGVSGFGISGTNVHVVLEEAPREDDGSPLSCSGGALSGDVLPWVISGRGAEGLRAQAARLSGFLAANPDLGIADVGHSLTARALLEDRAVAIGGTRGDLLAGVEALAAGATAENVVKGSAAGRDGVVFVFPGQGSQWLGMARELLDCSPVFAARMGECGEALAPHVDWSLADVLSDTQDASLLDRIEIVQPVLFAVMVSLASLWDACGVRPDVVVGHSQGEIAAACVAGGLSLEDAAHVVALRSRALERLAGKGGMVSVALGREELGALLEDWGDRVALAAVNGPHSAVVSGDPEALGELLGKCEEQGVRARKIAVDYAAHSAQVEAVREELLAGCASIVPSSSGVALYSTVTGGSLDTAELDGEYWYRNLRETVHFEQVIRALLSERRGVFVEVSPHPVLTVGIQETIDDCAEGDGIVTVGSLRRGEGGPERFMTSLAELFVRGVEVDWTALYKGLGARRVRLPSYAFQRERYWLDVGTGNAGDVGAAGLSDANHPLLGAAVALADGEGWVFTGRLSLSTHPWLADHAAMGVVLLAGTAFVELALRAGREIGCELVQELVLEAPLTLGEQDVVQVQLAVGEPDEAGARALSVYSRLEEHSLDGALVEGAWTCNATGVLAPDTVGEPSEQRAVEEQVGGSAGQAWPPSGAVEVQVEDLYDVLAARGLEYGAAFRGLRAVWRQGADLFVEVELPSEQRVDAELFELHPALLDATLHALAIGGPDERGGEAADGPLLTFAWSGVRLRTAGAPRLRARLASLGDGAVSVTAVDEVGRSVVSIGSLALRPISQGELGGRHHSSLFGVGWLPLQVPARTADSGLALLGGDDSVAAAALRAAGVGLDVYEDLDALAQAVQQGTIAPRAVLVECTGKAPAGGGPVAATHAGVKRSLSLLQGWLADGRLADVRLALFSSGAVSARDGEDVSDLGGAAVWGLVRSAQSEHPGRFVLVDLDAQEASWSTLPAVLALEEPQLAVRAGVALAPRLTRQARAKSGADAELPPFGAEGTVLVTGGTGGLGALVARHLVVSHGVRSLVLLSRRGPAAEGAAELERELTAHGAKVEVLACDVSDRAALAARIAAVPAERPLRAVVHAAGTLDDGVIDSLTAAQVDGVLAPKADAAWHLHELTEQLDLRAFVLFSSAAGAFGAGGQGNYLAANAFLDALAAHRRARGLAGVSVAWGMWAAATGMTGGLGEADVARMARLGSNGLSAVEGLELFDIACALDEAQVVAARIDAAALGAWARAAAAPAMLRGLVGVSRRRSAGAEGALADTLRGVPAEERMRVVLKLVRNEVAGALGHASPAAVDPERAFKELGFDSLSGLELRNRLSAMSGLRLPATLVFDHPNTAAVARHLLGELDGLHALLDVPKSVVASPDEPIAIIGMSCRYPGEVRSPEGLWDLVVSEGEGQSRFPEDRGWDLQALYDPSSERVGTSYICESGFLHDAGEFDPGFFGISPREALVMDPQQRLMLESSWEALEDASIDPVSLRGSRTGVFTGVMYHDYAAGAPLPESLAGYVGANSAGSLVSGRVAYAFGLEGPAVSVDTACSSSLVTLHLACGALRGGECDLALAGGVTVMASPGVFVDFSRQGNLARDARCKSFADAADGTAFSEGVGVLLLERLSDARRNGHRVLGLVRGSAVNQDGASNGLTAPNGPSQERVIRQALASAGLAPDQIDVVEAHGTGTVLGDPIEAQALLATYGKGRRQGHPLWLGSLKSNIGHTQAAAGAGGVIKMVMAMRHEVLPKTLHVDSPSTNVDWSVGAVSLLTESRPWSRNGEPRRAGVSSFGISGTNAHVILEEAPAQDDPAPTAEGASGSGTPGVCTGPLGAGAVPWVVSGKGPGALSAQARRILDFVGDAPGVSAQDVALSLLDRAALEHRGVVVGGDRQELLAGLGALGRGEAGAGVVEGMAELGDGVVFVFPGQGSQWEGMAVELLDCSPVFAAAMRECEEALGELVDWSAVEVLRGAEGAPTLELVEVVQPVLFAVMVSLARLWGACGVHPDAVVGHSQGEIAAAHVAGGLSLRDAAQVVALRSRALAGLAGRGGMASVAAAVEEVQARIERFDGRVSIAGVNGPSSVVVSGDPAALEELLGSCAAEGVRGRAIPVDYAAHSFQVEEIREALLEGCAGIAPRSGDVPFYSSVTGGLLDTAGMDERYWYRNLRETVQFERATRALLVEGYRAFIEIGPHPVLAVGLRESAEAVLGEEAHEGSAGPAGAGAPVESGAVPVESVGVLGSLRRGEGGARRFLASLGEAWVRGVPVDWGALTAGSGAQRLKLPTYAFQRERFWLETGSGEQPGAADGAGAAAAGFWEAVEQGEVGGLAGVLELDEPDRRAALGEVLPVLSDWWRRRRGESVVDGWRYRIAWKRLSDRSEGGRQGVLGGVWLVVVPAGVGEEEWIGAVVRALRARGARVVEIEVDVAGGLDRGALAERLREDGAELVDGVRLEGVLSLLAVAEGAGAESGVLGGALAASLVLAQALADAEVPAPLWLATREAVAVSPAEPLEGPAQRMVWGLGLTLGLERPAQTGGLVDLPRAIDKRAAGRLCGLLGSPSAEDQLAVRSTGLFARRLVRAPLGSRKLAPGAAGSRTAQAGWTPRGTVLVTGGTGGLGAHVARWLARSGAERLLLVSRRGPQAPGATELKDQLEALGAGVSVVACDVADRGELQRLLASIPAEHPLDAVVHAAGVGSLCELGALTVAQLQQTLAAKASGALHLHELTEHAGLSAFVLFSSMAAVLGAGGQGDYAAANAFLDGLAEHRRARGLPATSVAWGLWAGEGMGGPRAEQLHRRGLLDMAPELAIGALGGALDRDETCVMVSNVEWERYARSYASARERSLIGDLPEVQRALAGAAPDPSGATAPGGGLAERLLGLTAGERRRLVLELVCTEAAGVLGHAKPDAVRPRQAFRELGFDSLMAVELRDRLQRAAGLGLPATAVFDYPTPEALAGYLMREAAGEQATFAPARSSLASIGEPVAIVGMSCRYPGPACSPEELWQLVASGADAISGFPVDRGWDLAQLYDPDPDHPRKSYAREGGFVRDVTEFDAGFFGIGPREALAMDPQQRLLLEGCWEAVEHAGIAPSSLRGSQTGVFAGINPSAYAMQLPEEIEGYQVTAGAGSAVTGRVSYVLGLEGPAVSVDTACSSGLVALHLACGAVRAGECSLALAGGVAVLSSPMAFVAFSRQRGLARDGRCKSYADAADGTSWSEGVGVVLLERLSDAQRLGHRVLAVVRGSAVNQDGASNGLSAPNGPSQQRVIMQALDNAGLAAEQVDAVEGHGTGTSLGDPIEAQALLATYGRERAADHPLWLGSIKSNIGHSQAASGMAGVIKMVMALQRGLLPRTLHVDEPSKQVDWSSGTVALLVEEVDWQRVDGPRRAGVSSFGVSGTNAHLILEEAPPGDVESNGTSAPIPAGEGAAEGEGARAAGGAMPWVISGRGAGGLDAQARKLLERIERDPAARAVDIGFSLAASRAALEHRAAVLGGDRETLLEGLRALARGDVAPGLVRGEAYGGRGGLAFLFTGQGAQRVGMGCELYERFPAFRDALDEVCGHLDGLLERSLLGVMWSKSEADRGSPGSGSFDRASHGEGLLNRTMFAQAGLFALEVALFRLIEDWGVHPDYLVGHSIGELAAAHVAGVLSLQDACKLVAARGRLMESLPAGGAMVSVQASEGEVRETLAGLGGGRIALAAVNSPVAVVCSGDEDAVLELAGVWEKRGRKTKRLRVSHAFHSPRMEAMLQEFGDVAAGLSFTAPEIPIVSNLTGASVSAAEICDPRYWVRHVREPVRFYGAIGWLAGQRVASFLELGPDGVLSAMVHDCLADEEDLGRVAGGERGVLAGAGLGGGHPVTAVSVLRAERGEAGTLLAALAELWAGGAEVDWAQVFRGSDARLVELPTYAFQRRRYWLDPPAGGSVDAVQVGSGDGGHSLLGKGMELAEGQGWLFTGRISEAANQWVVDHAVLGNVLVPGTTFVDLALHAGREVGCTVLQELVMEAPLVLSAELGALLQVAVGESDASGRRALGIYARADWAPGEDPGEVAQWTRLASGALVSDPSAVTQGPANTGEAARSLLAGVWPPPQAEPVPIEDIYSLMAEAGVEYGPAFKGVRAAWRQGDELFSEVCLPEVERGSARTFDLHPALLDAALQASVLGAAGEVGLAIPFAWSGASIHVTGACTLRVRLCALQAGGFSLLATDERGTPVVSIDSLVLRPVSAEQLERARTGGRESLFGIDWVAVPAGRRAGAGMPAAVVGAEDGPLARALRAAGVPTEVYAEMDALSEAADGETAHEVVLVDCDDGGVDPASDLVGAVHACTNRALDVLQRWLADERFAASRLVMVTRGAVVTHAGPDLPGLAQAGVWGLVRSAQAESPGRLVLVDLDGAEVSWEALPAALAASHALEESQLAIRAGDLLAPRLTAVARPADPSVATHAGDVLAADQPRFGAQGTVLLTGGTGGLGVLLARHLIVRYGVRQLLLASRGGPEAQGAGELEAELTGLGAEVRIAACDVSVREQLEALIASIPAEQPLSAVVHVAGVLDDGVVDSLSAERVDGVLAPKVDGAWHLHELTEHLDLSAFVLFSSLAGVLGGVGQASYAAANTFLDGLAAYRQARGLTGVSLAWGMWAAGRGMADRLGELDRTRMVRSGAVALSGEEGLALFDRAQSCAEALLIPMHLDGSTARSWASAETLHPLLRGLIRKPAARGAGLDRGSLATRLAGAREQERGDIVLEAVRIQAAAVLGYAAAGEIDPRRTFQELGFDSLAAVEFRNRMNTALGLRLPATLIFDFPTPGALAGYLLSEVAGDGMTSAAALDAELDELEQRLAPLAADDSSRLRVKQRLQAILSSLGDGRARADDGAVAQRMQAASAEEIFDLIDSELQVDAGDRSGYSRAPSDEDLR
jgi:acyl transferase domain-containing protein/acyl carrier protein